MDQSENVTRDKLVSDLKVVVADAEELLRATAGQAGEKVAAARARAEEGLVRARSRIKELEGQVAERGRLAARATDEFVHREPWKSVGIAAGVGLIVGLLIGRR
jgi:ElaB/YqjD/DUF883 family membrane-anchored ribosome-binding protein